MEFRIEIIKDGSGVRYRAHDAAGREVVPWTTLAAGDVHRAGDGREVATISVPTCATVDTDDANVRETRAEYNARGRADVDTREPWQRVAEDDMGLRVTRPSPHHVQFRCAESGRVEADWWPSTGKLKIHGLAGGATGTWTDVRAPERALHLMRQS